MILARVVRVKSVEFLGLSASWVGLARRDKGLFIRKINALAA